MPRALSKPKVEHACRIGYKLHTVTQAEADERNAARPYLPASAGTFIVDDLAVRDLPKGSVVACEECGRVWVKDQSGIVTGKHSVAWVNHWRPETRWERHKRARVVRARTRHEEK